MNLDELEELKEQLATLEICMERIDDCTTQMIGILQTQYENVKQKITEVKAEGKDES